MRDGEGSRRYAGRGARAALASRVGLADRASRALFYNANFIGRLLNDPRRVGAVLPSGRVLAAAMAACVDPARGGRILELGPGTGAITKALIERGVAPERITALEFDTGFARMLGRRFPGIEVIEGDALELVRGGPLPFTAVLSSLPLLNFSDDDVTMLVEGLLDNLPRDALFIQFSYGRKPPLPIGARVRATLVAAVWRNLPPARVWRFRTR